MGTSLRCHTPALSLRAVQGSCKPIGQDHGFSSDRVTTLELQGLGEPGG